MGEAQQVGGGQQHDKLSAQGGDGGVDAVAQRGEGGTQGDADGSHGEVDADDPQGAASHGEEIIGGAKQSQQRVGRKLEHQHAGAHDAQGKGVRYFIVNREKYKSKISVPAAGHRSYRRRWRWWRCSDRRWA